MRELFCLNPPCYSAQICDSHLMVNGGTKALPLPEASFDVVIANSSIWHLYKLQAVIDDIRHVLRLDVIVPLTITFQYRVHAALNEYVRFARSGLLHHLPEFPDVENLEFSSCLSTVANLYRKLTCEADGVFLDFIIKLMVFPLCVALIKLSRFERTVYLTHVKFGKLPV